jgi:UDP-glucose 4-epimerase
VTQNKNVAASSSFDASIKGRRVFITGADGFIGSHLTEACVLAGASKVTALARYSALDSDGWLDDLTPTVRNDVEVLRGDVKDGEQMRSMICGSKPQAAAEVVFHLAALIGVPYSFEAPSAYVDTNVTGSLNVFVAAKHAQATRVVHTSTSEVYGTAQTDSISETHPLVAQSPYAASKIAADKLAEALCHASDSRIVTLRPFNTYGPRQSQRAVIATTIRQALDPECSKVRLGDLSSVRDFTYVADTVQAFLAAAGPGVEPGEVYNCGSDECRSIETVVNLALGIVSRPPKGIEREPARIRPLNSEVRALRANFDKFSKATGWRPQTSLEDGLAETVKWWKSRPLTGGRGYRV